MELTARVLSDGDVTPYYNSNMEDKELYKQRRGVSCIRLASVWLMDNIWSLLRRTWIPILLMAVVTGLLAYGSFSFIQGSINDVPTTRLQAILNIIQLIAPPYLCVLVFFGFFSWALSPVMSMLNKAPVKQNFKRTFTMFLSIAALLTAFFVIIGAVEYGVGVNMVSHNTPVATLLHDLYLVNLIILLVMIIHLPPLHYAMTRHLFEQERKLPSLFGSGMLTGFRYWSYLFLIFFITAILFFVISLVAFLPLAILYIATDLNTFGMIVMGDPSGLPAYFPLLGCLTNIVTLFIVGYVSIWIFMIYYYAYGAIEAKKASKKREKEESSETKQIEQ